MSTELSTTTIEPIAAQAVGAQRRDRRWATSRRWQVLTLGIDTLVVTLGAILAQGAGAGGQEYATSMMVVFVASTIGLLGCTQAYAPRLATALTRVIALCVGVTAVATMLSTLGQSLFFNQLAGTDGPARLWVVAALLLSGSRTILALGRRTLRRAGEGMEPTLIIGAGQVGRLVAKRLTEQPELGLAPIGFLDNDPIDSLEGDNEQLQVLGTDRDLERTIERQQVQHVVLAFSNAPHSELLDLIRRCDSLGTRISVVPRLFERTPSRINITHVGGLPLLELQPVNPHAVQFGVKYIVDRIVAAIAILVLAPVLLVTAVAVLLSLGRPIVFKQRRVGRDGREFNLLKFRTMQNVGEPAPLDFSDETAPGGVEGADRRTRIGRLLRKYSLDELPQLLNVLRGEMSIVGPRPERPEFVSFFDDNVYRYGERHRVKGGLTGWAQIHGFRGRSSIADRVEWDNFYIENFSLWLDLKIVVRTIPVIFRGTAE